MTVEAFNAKFEEMFAKHDVNNNGFLEKEEAKNFMIEVASVRPDGKEFNEENFNKLFDEKSTDGKISKETAHAMGLKRGQTLGFIQA